MLDAIIQDSRYCLLNIYAPNKCSEPFQYFQNISEEIKSLTAECDSFLIVGGDFNVILGEVLDGRGGNKKRKESSKFVEEMCVELDLIEIWRIRNPTDTRFTWRQKTPIIQRRLDYWLVSDCLQVDSLNYAFEYGELSNSQKQAIITLIEKKGKDKRLIKNWRPISLINVDAKIASKALAKRLEKTLPEIIHYNQNAFVKGRTIFDAIRTIEDVKEHTKQKCLSGILVAVDFEKAFDTLNFNYLIRILHEFNFGPSFIQWIRG